MWFANETSQLKSVDIHNVAAARRGCANFVGNLLTSCLWEMYSMVRTHLRDARYARIAVLLPGPVSGGPEF